MFHSMNRKIIAMLLTWMLLLQMIVGNGMVSVSANNAAIPSVTGSVTGDTYGITGSQGKSGQSATISQTSALQAIMGQADSLLTKVTVKDPSGTVIDAVYNPDRVERSQLGDAVRIEYEWALENGHSYKSGDTFEFDIPQEFVIYSNINGQLMMDGGLSVGDFTVDTAGHVTMTFNSMVENYSEVGGMLQINTEFSTQTIRGSVEVPIYFPIRGGDQVALVNFQPWRGTPLEKDGVADKDIKIDWTLDVNTSLDTIQHAEISDQLPAGLELDPASIRVYKLLPNVDRAPDLGAEVASGANVYTLTTETDGSAFRIAFNDTSLNSAYRVVYSTWITDEEKTSFTNAAELNSQQGNVARKNDTVNIKREKLVTKEAGAYDDAKQTVTWTLKYNYGEKDIPQSDAFLEDRFEEDMELVPGSFKVTDALTGDELLASLYQVTPVVGVNGKNGFDLQFTSDVQAAYNIQYQTKATDRVFQNHTVTNDVVTELSGKETTATATHTFRSSIGVKSIAATDYSAKEVTWRIVVNRDQWSMSNLVIDDAFTGGGLTYLPGSLSITSTGDPVLPYTLDDSEPDKGFKLSFTGTFEDTYTITYKTAFDAKESVYGNTALLDWTEKTSQSTDPVRLQASFRPNAYTINNGYKSGQYNAREKRLTWDVIVNYNSFAIPGALFKDELKEGQKLDLDSVKVYHAQVQANGEVLQGAEITLSPDKISYNANLLTIDLGDISTPYWITLNTRLDNTLVAEEIPNTAGVTGTDGAEWSWDRKVTIPRGEVYVSKTGARNGDLVDWEIKINEGQSLVENARIIDTPSANQVLVRDSFKLYKGDVAANGTVTSGALLTPGTDYEVVFHKGALDEESFELIFNGSIDTAYVLRYSSEIAVTADREPVTNEVSFVGDGVTSGVKETEYSVVIRFSDGSGTGSIARGAITLTKVDEDNASLVLADATYDLHDSSGRLIGQKVTDNLGQLSFTKLLYGTYTLTETTAPAGYELDTRPHTIVIDSAVLQTGGVKRVTMTNKKTPEPEIPVNPGPGPGGPGVPQTPEYELQILKVDDAQSDLVLEGATFLLKDSSQQLESKTVTTDAFGKAVFTKLQAGQYTLEEIKAPQGYVLEANAVRHVNITTEGVRVDGLLVQQLVVTNHKESATPVTPEQPTPETPKPEEPSRPGGGGSKGDKDRDRDELPGNSTVPTETPVNDTSEEAPTTPGGTSNQDGGTNPGSAAGETDTTSTQPAADAEDSEGDHSLVDQDGQLGEAGDTLANQSTDEDNANMAPHQNASVKGMLPQTGEGSSLPLQLMGLLVILLGVWMTWRTRVNRR